MSNHPEASVTPVEANEPPYYVAVFTTVRTQDQSGYSETSARMEDLVKDVPGFLGITARRRLAGCPSPSGTSATPTPSQGGDPMPSAARRRSAGRASGTGATHCMWRKWSGATGSPDPRRPSPARRVTRSGRQPHQQVVVAEDRLAGSLSTSQSAGIRGRASNRSYRNRAPHLLVFLNRQQST
jgi:hypothetical protein